MSLGNFTEISKSAQTAANYTSVAEMVAAGLGKRQTIERILDDFAQNRNVAILGENGDPGDLSDDFAQMSPDYEGEDISPMRAGVAGSTRTRSGTGGHLPHARGGSREHPYPFRYGWTSPPCARG